MKNTYGKNYSYLNIHFRDWKRPVYRLWWLVRVIIEIIIPIRLPIGAKILSVGSGLGFPEHYLSKIFGFNIYMADISSYAKELNRKLFGNTNFVVAEATRLPFPDKFFDLIISYDLIEHLENEKKAKLSLLEMKRVLKSRKGINMFHKITVKEDEEMENDSTHRIKWCSLKWKRWFESMGFKVVRPITHFIPVWANRRIKILKINGSYYISTI